MRSIFLRTSVEWESLPSECSAKRRACVPFSGKLRKTIGGYVGFPGFYEIIGEKVTDEKANMLEMEC